MSDTPSFARRSQLLEDAFAFAREAHHGGRREGDTDIDHPVAVAQLLADAGFDDEVVAAGLLHDVVEDTRTGVDELRRRFGDRVAALVQALTEDESLEPYERRKAAHRAQVRDAGADAAAVFLADKLASARKLDRKGKRPKPRKLAHYVATLETLADAYPQLPFIDELRARLATWDERAAAAGRA